MTTWDNLLTAAMLGTERRKLEIGDDAPALAQRLASADAEHTLLVEAAAMLAYRRAGYVPDVDESTLDSPAPDETTPRCSSRALMYLRVMLDAPQEYHALLIEWLTAAARKGWRVPYPYLPSLLDMGKRNAPMATAVAGVTGERGRWLAAQFPSWQHMSGSVMPPPDVTPPRAEPTEAEKQVIDALKSDKNLIENAALSLLLTLPSPWSAALVEAFVDKLIDETRHGRIRYYAHGLFGMIGSIPPALLNLTLQRLRAEPKKGLEDLIERLQFRRDMLEEFERG
jgi:hypothetical protein